METEKIEKHINVDFPKLEQRVTSLEKASCDLSDIQIKLGITTERVDLLSSTVKEHGTKIEQSFSKMREAYDAFGERIRKNYRSFIFALTTSILISLLGGLYAQQRYQFKLFQEVHKAIHMLEKKIIVLQNMMPKDSVP